MSPKEVSLKQPNCLNCGYPFDGQEKFCAECGQKNKGKNLKLKDFMREVFAGFLSWDAKFWRTLLPLLTKPGKISKDYIEGKRIRFTNPFRFFFIISIVFFFLVKLTTNYENDLNFNNNKGNVKKDSITNATIFKKDIGSYIMFQKKHPKIKAEAALDSLKEENTFSNRLFYKKAKTINELSDNTDETIIKLIKLGFSYLSSAFLFLLPVFALFLKFVYIRRKQNYMNHLIFVFHIATFFFICLVFFQLVTLIPFIEELFKNNVFKIIKYIMIFSVYPFIAMKTFYQQSNIKTFLKLLLISFVFSLMITFAISLIFIFAFLMM